MLNNSGKVGHVQIKTVDVYMILTLDGQTSKRNLQLMKADIHKF